MHWIDWCIAIIPLIAILGLAVYSGRYIRGVVDFLAAGRVAGRYVISVGDMASGLSVMLLVAMCEQKYQIGYGIDFWAKIIVPAGIIFRSPVTAPTAGAKRRRCRSGSFWKCVTTGRSAYSPPPCAPPRK